MMNLSNFKAIIIAALWSGLLAGLLLTAVQHIQVIPLLLEAEVYEQSTTAALNEHHAEAWQPENGFERTFFTGVANISLAVGFALLLGAASSLRNGLGSWRIGLLWGLAGYLAFFVAPSLGLPPELPGTEAGNLKDRQIWWFMAVFDTAMGLWLLCFAKTHTNKFFGAVLLLAPHLVSAPQHVHGSTAPAELAQSFIIASAYTNGLFWLALGGLMGKFYHHNHAV